MSATTIDRTSRDFASYTWLLFSAVAAGFLFPLTAKLAGLQDGDGLLTSIISTDKLTWYFWGQDRFLNFIPGVASVFQDSDFNLRFQLFLRTFFAYLAPFGVLVFFRPPARLLLLSVAVSNVILVLCLSDYALFNLYVQHNPFGTSLTLFGLAFVLRADLQKWGVPSLLLALVLCFFAYAVNFALLVFAVPFLVLLWLLRSQQRRDLLIFFAINVSAIGLAYAHSRVFGEPSTSYSVALSWQAVHSACENLAKQIGRLPLLTGFLMACYCLRRSSPFSRLELAGLVSIAGMMVLVLSNTAWVQMNSFNVRYFMTAAIVSATVAGLIISSFMLEIKSKMLHLGALMFACGIVLLAGLRGFHRDFAELVHPVWREPAKLVAAEALNDHARFIIGEFWDVWPVVYELHRQRSPAQNRDDPVFGATFRAHPLSARIVATTLNKGPQTALCFMATAPACIDYARTFAQIPGDIKMTLVGQKTVQAGKQTLLELSLRLEQ